MVLIVYYCHYQCIFVCLQCKPLKHEYVKNIIIISRNYFEPSCTFTNNVNVSFARWVSVGINGFIEQFIEINSKTMGYQHYSLYLLKDYIIIFVYLLAIVYCLIRTKAWFKPVTQTKNKVRPARLPATEALSVNALNEVCETCTGFVIAISLSQATLLDEIFNSNNRLRLQ